MTSAIGYDAVSRKVSQHKARKHEKPSKIVAYLFQSFVNNGAFSKLHNCLFDLVSTRITFSVWISSHTFLDAPARLKKELDTVLNLQGDLDAVDNAIQLTRATLAKSSPSQDSLQMLSGLEQTHEHLKEKVEALYTSLNVHESFPELHGIDLEFVRTLLMARDLKINIRKRAIGSFFEWEKLDQAVGGRDQAIGMVKFPSHRPLPIATHIPRNQAPSTYTQSYCQTKTGPYECHPQIQQVLRETRGIIQTRVGNPVA